MKYKYLLLAVIMLFASESIAQKNKRKYKLQEPHRDHKTVKLGYVGSNPTQRPKKVKFMKPEQGRRDKKYLVVSENKIKKPRRKTDFIAADKTPQNKSLRVPKKVNDKQMVLPKMKGDKRANKVTKYGFKGADPSMSVNTNKEKRVSDIQYRSNYKFDKKGTFNKKFFRKKQKD